MVLEPGEVALRRGGAYGLGITAFGLVMLLSELVRDAHDMGAPFEVALGVAAAVGALWLVVTTMLSQVVVGHDHVRVRNGFRTTTFRRAAQPQALRVHSRGWIRPRAGVLYVEQEGERAALRLSPMNQQRVLEILQLRPYDFHPGGQSIETVPVELRPAIAWRHSRNLGVALAVAGVVATFVWAFLVAT